MTDMTKTERNDLAGLVRKRERLMKTAASQRSADLLAEFESQLGTIYAFDNDEIWAAAHAAAEDAVKFAQVEIAKRCEDLGIPAEFAPGISLGWYGRGENMSKDRRAELRKMATTRLAAMEKAARTEIEKYSIEAQTELIAGGLTTEAAQAFLTSMPEIETLMPVLDATQVQGLLEYGKKGAMK